MRTTLNLDDRVVRAAKRYAGREGTTLTAVIDMALRQFLAGRPSQSPSDFRLELKVRATRVRSGVDIADRDGLCDLMEGRG
jgi:hypothetical protein